MEEMIQRIAAERLGAAPAGAAPTDPAAAPAPAAAPPAAPTPKPVEVPAKAEAKTENDKGDELPVVYEVMFGDSDKRQLTQKQIASTFERYAALNDKHANMKPIIKMAAALMEKSGLPADQLATTMVGALKKAMMPNTQFGDNKLGEGVTVTQQKPADNETVSAQLDKWAQENSVAVPPGMREMFGEVSGMKGQLGQMMGMMQRVLQAGGQIGQGAQQAAAQAASAKKDATKQRIAQHLSFAQQKHQLPGDAFQDMLGFMAERGYTFEDFIDPQLADSVVGDFSRVRATPEMDRMRAILGKRSAVQGSMGTSPAAGGGAAKPTDDMLARLADKAIAKRG